MEKKEIPKTWQELHEDTQKLLKLAGAVILDFKQGFCTQLAQLLDYRLASPYLHEPLKQILPLGAGDKIWAVEFLSALSNLSVHFIFNHHL